MRCPACSHDNRDAARFCESCAAPVKRACAGCGSELRPTAKFCDECAQPVDAPAAAPPSSRSPLSYTPKHLADEILQSKSALEGERKQVTVLFADVKGSLELAEQLDPEQWHCILERFFEILTEGVHRFEGTVNQYTGDGIMALFGAPLTHEDHAQRACYAALHLRGSLRGYADELRRTRGINLSVRMGMNSGEVVVGKIGDDLRMDYTAQGHVVGLAQRMESLAEAGCAYLAESTARLVRGFFELRALGAFEIRGTGAPLEVYALEGLGRLRTRLDLSRSRGFSKFVGRSAEVARLADALANVTQGNGQVVCVVADAGVGKSRLCAEFVEGCQARSILVNETHCPAHGKTVPLLPMLGLVRSFFRIEERDSDAEARRKVAGTLILLDKSFQEALPLVFEFLGIPDPERPAPVLAPEDRHHRLLEFVRRFVRARSAREASVILIDDLHWIDPTSDEFVAQLADVVHGTRTLLLVNYRPEYEADWLRRSHVGKLALAPLGEEAIAELVRDRVGNDASVAALPARIHQRTGGNPFFAEEVIQSLIESGALAGTRGAYKLVTAVDAIEIPDRVQVILAARIDRLPEVERQVLHAAAVIGRNFDAELLEAVSELPGPELRAALDHLDTAEMIHATSLYPIAEYTFKHPLTHEVATRSQLAAPRQGRHAAVAKALEARHAGKLDEHAALLAHHCEEGGLPLEAARWHSAAARWIGSSDTEESLRHWRRIPALIAAAPDAEVAELGLLSAIQMLRLGGQQGISAESAAEILERGNRWAAKSQDPDARARLLHNYGRALAFRGELVPGLEAMEQARAGEIQDEALRTEVELYSAWGQHNVGRLHQARATFEAAIAADGRGEGPDTPLLLKVMIQLLYSFVLDELGMFAAADQAVASARRLAKDGIASLDPIEQQSETLLRMRRVPRSLTKSQNVLHRVRESRRLARRGELAAATREAAAAVELAQAQRNTNMSSVGMLYLGEIHAQCENWPAAQSALEESLRIARESGTTLNLEARMLAQLACAHLGQGEPARAWETAREALAVARKRGARHHEALAQIVLADVLLTTAGPSRREDIEAALLAAAALIEETGAALYDPDLVRVRERARAELKR